MNITKAKIQFTNHKENSLFGRYVCNDHILPLINKLSDLFEVKTLGKSVKKNEIVSITVGNGNKKILMWSQMHGNESTTTKALFDLFNFLKSNSPEAITILQSCTLTVVPILNPDGAEVYTRANANSVDLNRDAQDLSQPESVILRSLFDTLTPDFCFNLHGQRTIFSAGKTKNVATVSFLSPAQDQERTISKNRSIAMEVIAKMNTYLQQIIPDQVGIYDDSFNINCVGDTFQSLGVPTLLFEAGHFPGDYERERTRELLFYSYLVSLLYISKNEVTGDRYEPYLDIPKNDKSFFDILIRNAKIETNSEIYKDIAVQFQEILSDGKIVFSPKIEKIGHLNSFYGHLEIDAEGSLILTENSTPVFEGYENDFVLRNNEKFQLNLIKS